MTGAIANLLLNILIVGLLGVTIGYCWLLNKRIRILQDSRSELAQLLKHFDEATRRASESIIGLQSASKKIGENIQFRIDKANYLIDDISFMIEKGNRLASQMEASFAVNRARNKTDVEKPMEDNAEEAETLGDVFVPKAAEEKAAIGRVATLEAMLERVMGRNKRSPESEVEPTVYERPMLRETQPPPRPRSKAEQELLDMIKAGIKG